MTQRDNQRALSVIRTLRGKLNRQNRQINMLCRDMVDAHSQFVLKMSQLNFSAAFCETLLAARDIETLIELAAMVFGKHLKNASTAVFLLDGRGYNIHIGSHSQSSNEKEVFENWFSPAVVAEISRNNRVCTMQEMLAIGLQANPASLKHIAAIAVPLGQLGRGVGFVLLYRPADMPFDQHEASMASVAASGLRSAIMSFRGDQIPATDHRPAEGISHSSGTEQA